MADVVDPCGHRTDENDFLVSFRQDVASLSNSVGFGPGRVSHRDSSVEFLAAWPDAVEMFETIKLASPLYLTSSNTGAA
jgi:hypothetical protein